MTVNRYEPSVGEAYVRGHLGADVGGYKDRNHQVKITKCDNGVVVHVGCKTLVYPVADEDQFMEDLGKYLFGTTEEVDKIIKKYK